MASFAPDPPHAHWPDRLLPDRLLGALALVLLLVAAVAVLRGQADWGQVPRTVWLHLFTIAVVLALTPVMLTRRKGDRLHRRLGWVWAGALWATALFSLTIAPPRGQLVSPIVLLSLFVLYAVPRLILQARAHQVAAHRATVRGLVIGGLLIAGFFTFTSGRLLDHWLFG